MPHPRTDFADQLKRPSASAASLGYRMPAEWEPMAKIWLTRPHNAETWPGCLAEVQKQHDEWMRAMRPYIELGTTQELGAPTNDSWIRDFGPIFVIRDQAKGDAEASAKLPRKAMHDFHFNGWGGKYELRDLDDVVPQHIARKLDLPLWIHDQVLEGGSIDVNGRGTVMTTEQCLLNANRNPTMNRADVERMLHDALGTRHVIWLPGGIIGDDTDGHIDDLARFISPDAVIGIRAPEGHPDFQMLDRNWQALQTARDQDGKRLNVIPMPVPDIRMYEFPSDEWGPGGVLPVPASYANFLFANGAVFVPIFGQKQDDVALRTLEEALPRHKIIGIRSEFLVIGLGSLHCMSQQEPV